MVYTLERLQVAAWSVDGRKGSLAESSGRRLHGGSAWGRILASGRLVGLRKLRSWEGAESGLVKGAGHVAGS